MNKKIAYIIYEGITEERFYKYIFNKYISRYIKRKYKNLGTGCGINKEVAKHLIYFAKQNPGMKIYAYVFFDREGTRANIPVFNASWIKKLLKKTLVQKQNVKFKK